MKATPAVLLALAKLLEADSKPSGVEMNAASSDDALSALLLMRSAHAALSAVTAPMMRMRAVRVMAVSPQLTSMCRRHAHRGAPYGGRPVRVSSHTPYQLP